MLRAFGAGVYHGPGDYLVGANLGLRNNFVQPAASLVIRTSPMQAPPAEIVG
jgi:hypothetical protein